MKVYHAKKLRPDELHWPKDYDLVATVDTESLEWAYQLTKHLNGKWWKTKAVTCHRESRSTSIIDVVVNSEGRAFVCAPVGWQEVEEGNTIRYIGLGRPLDIIT